MIATPYYCVPAQALSLARTAFDILRVAIGMSGGGMGQQGSGGMMGGGGGGGNLQQQQQHQQQQQQLLLQQQQQQVPMVSICLLRICACIWIYIHTFVFGYILYRFITNCVDVYVCAHVSVYTYMHM